MLDGRNFFNASGVILYRDLSGEKGLWLKLFLKDVGIINVTARKTNGDTEPLLWGKFILKKKHRSTNYFIEDFEVVDDMFFLKKKQETLFTAVKWLKMIMRRLMPGQPDNELLINLYWSLHLLKDTKIPADVADWKFLWQWLENWGLAPDLVDFYTSQKFNHDEIVLLTQISMLNTRGVIELFSKKISPNIRKNSFKIASRLTEKFFNEK